MKKWRIIVVVVVMLVFCFENAKADKYVRGIIHAHGTNSDGIFPEKMYIANLAMTGSKFLITTDHLDCLIGKCGNISFFDKVLHQKHQKNKISNVYKYLQQQKAPFFRCIECFTDLDGQHILLLGTSWKNVDYSWNADTEKILDYAKKNNLVSILAHPHDGYQLEYVNRFDALEFFNTKGFDLIQLSKRLKNEKYDKAEDLDLEIYCQAAKQYINGRENNMPGITGGCDIHFNELELSFGLTFIAVPDVKKIDLFSIISSVSQGKTCAVFSNIIGMRAWIDSLNYQPNRSKIYKTKKIRLKGKITAENCNKLYVYVDGNKYQELDIDVNKRAIDFDLPIDAGTGKHVVFLYCKNRLITSPIIFDVTGEEIPAVASTPTPTISSSPAVVKPKKFTESLKFHPYPTSGTGGGYYDYTVKDEMGKVVFKHQLDRHDCVVLAGNCVIVVAKAFDNGAWNIDDKTVPYYGQYFGYDRKKGVFVPFFTIAGTTRQYKANYSEAEHAIINRRRNEVICLDLLETFNELSKQELQFVKDIPDQIDKQLAVFLKTMPEEFFERYFNTNDYSDIKSIKRRIYKQYASVEMSSSCGFRLYVLLKRERERWRITYANSVNIISQSYSMSRDVIEKLHWQKAKIVNQYPEYHFYH